jgi:hypothetical protein
MVGSADLSTTRCKPITTHMRSFTLLPLLAVLVLLAGCGSASENASAPANASSDVGPLLRDTFNNLGKVKSATLDVKLAIDAAGTPGVSGPITAEFGGPFESQAAGKLPKFRFDLNLKSSGDNFTAGLTWTGDKAFVAFQGQDYAVSDLVARQFSSGYATALKSNEKNAKGGIVLATLGVDPTTWLKNARNEGDAKVGDVDTVKISGDADVGKVIDDVQKLADKAGKLNVPGAAGAATKITPAERQQAIDAIKQFTVTVYTGKADRILRRVTVAAVLNDAGSKTNAKVGLDITLTNVGESQDVQAPKNPKPFSELVKVTDSLGGLSALEGLVGGGSSSSGSSGGKAVPVPTLGAGASANIEKYAKCVQQAAGDAAKGAKCADLLTG